MKRVSFSSKLIRISTFIVFAVLLLFLLFHIGFDKIAEALISVGFSGAFILIVLGLLENGSDALALSFAIPGKIPFLKVFSSNSTGTLTNMLIPWEAGEFVKIGLLKKRIGTSSAIKGIVLWNYVLKLSKPCAIISILVISVVAGNDFHPEQFLLILLAAFLGFIPYLGMMIVIRSDVSVKIVKFLKLFGKKNVEGLLEKAGDMDNSLKKFRKERARDYHAVFFIQFFARFIAWAAFIVCARFAGFDYSFSVLSLAFCAVTLSRYIVSFIPTKIGVEEGAGYLIFSFLGLDGGTGLLVTLILRVKAVISLSIVSLFNLTR